MFPKGDDDPFSWSANMWNITKATITKGIKKCRLKNRLRVGALTAKPPHNHFTISGPKYGIAENRFVITVAPQKDICPQGSTYPKKDEAINKKKITIPTIQVSINE